MANTTMDSIRTRPLKVGIILPIKEYMMAGATPRWTDILAIARRAEDLGFDSLWITDHLLFELPGTDEPVFGPWECWSLLAALAATTRRVELGSLVLCTSFRNPALLAKMADTVDEISGGRLILGLGAGRIDEEFLAFGYPLDHRVSRFEEALTIIHTLLHTGQIDFVGQYYQARECLLRPRGPRPSGPPIMIGSTGPRMLHLAARCADSWNAWASKFNNTPAGFPSVRTAVDAACADVGRDPATLTRTATVLVESAGAFAYHEDYPGWWLPDEGKVLSGSPAELAAVFRAYAGEGVSHLQVWVNPCTLAGVEALAPVLEILDRGT